MIARYVPCKRCTTPIFTMRWPICVALMEPFPFKCGVPANLLAQVGSRKYWVKLGVKKQYLLNKNIVHLIDDIFWNMGFKTAKRAKQVIAFIILINSCRFNYFYYFYSPFYLYQLFVLCSLWCYV